MKKTQLNGHERCICGSGIKFKKCHPKALAGFKAIIEDARDLKGETK